MNQYLSDQDGRRALDWAFLYWGREWEEARHEVWPLFFAATIARQEGDRDYYAEVRLFALMVEEQQPRIGPRRMILGADVHDVMAVHGERVGTWLIWKNGTVYALVEALPTGLRFAGAVNVGAEPVDEQVARNVFFHAA